jgi:multidrug efflux pump subunit AcrB
MNLVQPAMRRPLTVIVLIIAVVLGAGLALQKMARDIFPPLGIPTIYVAQPYGGMDPAQMEGYLTYYYEFHFLYLTGIEHVESKSIQGASIIKLQFHPGTDMSQAMSETVAQVNRSRAFMPPGTVPPFVMRFDAGSVPVGNLVFSTDNPNRTVGQMQDAALNLVRPLFATLPGVSAPPPFGGSARSIVVNVKPERLRAYNMSPDEVVGAIAAANTISPSGNIILGDKYPMVPLNSVVRNIKDLEAVPVRTGVYPAVFIRDVAEVLDASDIVTCFALVNGRRTVYIPVTKRADASTLSVVNLVKANIPKFQSVLPEDVKVGYEFDQSPYVTRAIAGLTMEGALGAVLAGAMVLLFLRDWRSALVVVVNIPLSLLAAVFALWLSGQTINLMTLGGLALAVGVLVDMSTVAIENIHTHLAAQSSRSRQPASPTPLGKQHPLSPHPGPLPQGEGESNATSRVAPSAPIDQAQKSALPLPVGEGRGEGEGSERKLPAPEFARVARAVADSGKEVALPLLIAMLCVLAVFTPSFFMEGAAKALFLPLSLAVGFSMVASYFLASTFVPVISVWIIRAHRQEEIQTATTRYSAFQRFQDFYTGFGRKVAPMRWLVTAVYLLAAFGLIKVAGDSLGTEIFPKVDAGQLQLRLRAPSGTRVETTEAIALDVLKVIEREVGKENVDLSLGFVGVHPPTYPINLVYHWNGGPEEGVLQVQLKRGTPVRIDELKERLRQKLRQEMPGVGFSFEPSDIVSRVMSLGSPTPIEVAVSGPNLAANQAFAEMVRAKLEKIPALRDIQYGQSLNYPTVDVAVNRERAGLMGVKTIDVSRSLVAATASSRFTQPVYWADPNSGVAYQIQVQIPQLQLASTEELKNIPVSHRDGKPILLRNVASVNNGTAVGQYERYNMARQVTLTANIHGKDLGSVAAEINRAIKEVGDPPPRVNVALRGQVKPMEQLLDGLRTGLGLAVVVIFLLLAANFQSFLLAIVVVSTVPAVIAGVAATLWLTGTTINLQSFMGSIMAIGVAVANAILLVTFAERSRIGGMTAVDAALDGARSRLRPILMTSLAMMAGMAPMALGLGEGGEQTAPLGRAVIGGLAAATVATLLVLPWVFAIVRVRSSTKSRSLDPDDPLSGHYFWPVGHD